MNVCMSTYVCQTSTVMLLLLNVLERSTDYASMLVSYMSVAEISYDHERQENQ